MIMILFFFSLGFASKSCPLIKLHYFPINKNTCNNNNTTSTIIFFFFFFLRFASYLAP